MRFGFAAAFLVLCASTASRADVMYSFVGAGQISGSSFTVESPTFLNYSSAAVTPLAGEVILYGHDYGATTGIVFYSTSLEIESSSGVNVYIGLAYDVSRVGIYVDPYGDGTLSVTQTGSTAVTPEPSSVALLGTGLFCIAGVVRRRFA